jgi:Ca2+-binding RTX toxin-like protein
MTTGMGGPAPDTHTLALLDDAGGRFVIDGTQVKVAAALTEGTYTVRVKVTDSIGNVLEKDLTIEVEDAPANSAPTNLVLSANQIAENSASGTVIGELSATDTDGDTLTYTLEDDAGGKFALVTEEGVTKLVVNGAIDYETAASHDVTVKVSDGNGGETTQTFTIDVADVDETVGPLGTITLDASAASSGIDLEAFLRGGYIADATGGGFPVFDNGSAFSGEEMMIGYGSDATSKYVLAHGSLEYYFGTHTVWGEIGTIEYGTRGSGSYDANGYFTGGNVELKITGLVDFANALSPEAEVEATGEVHNFAIAHMHGASADPARLNLYADQLDEYAQHFIGSAYDDVYTGTTFADTIEGGGGDDTLDGGAGIDTVIYDGVYGGSSGTYSFTGGVGAAPLVITDSRVTGGTGVDTLTNVEYLKFNNLTYDHVNHRANYVPTDVALGDAEVESDAAVGTVVGSLVVTDPMTAGAGGPAPDTHTLALLDDAGGRFVIDGTQIKVAAALTEGTYTVRVKVTDSIGNVLEKDLTIEVEDAPANSGPEVSVSGNGVTIADGDSTADTADGTALGLHAVGDLVERTFTVTNGGTEPLKLSALKLPKGFKLAKGEKLDATIAPGESDTFTVVLDTRKVGDYSGVITFKTNDADESVFDFAVSATVSAPEIDVSGNGINILDNDRKPGSVDGTDFGNAAFGASVVRSFTINNTGGVALSIANVVLPAGFVLVGGFPATVAANSSATIEVQLDTTVTGEHKGDIVITSNDSNEALFNFTVQGTVIAQNLAGGSSDDTFAAQSHAEAFAGLDGIDTVSYEAAGAAVVASLLNPAKNKGFAAGDSYMSVENLRGSAFNDSLAGDNFDNIIEGGAGADRLDGGKAVDTASYANAASGVTADLLKSRNNLGDALGDTYKNIENLLGSAFNDTLVGSHADNAIAGGDGDDTIVGNKGIDELTGGLGADTFRFNTTKDGGDIVTDFVSGTDQIGILRSGFKIASAVSDVDFAAAYFVSGTGGDGTPSGVLATASGHGQFLFNEATDQLWWDADGTGKAAAVLLATVQNGAHVLATDFDLL